MEWAHMIVSESQNKEINGYGLHADPAEQSTQLLRLWSNFYCVPEIVSEVEMDSVFQSKTENVVNLDVNRRVFPTYSDVLEIEARNDTLFQQRYVELTHVRGCYSRCFLDKLIYKRRMKVRCKITFFTDFTTLSTLVLSNTSVFPSL